MVVIDTHLARGASNGAQPSTTRRSYGRTNRAKRFVCVDVTGLPLCVRVVPASTSEASAVEQILDDLVSRVRTNGWNSCSWTAARRGLAPRGCQRSSTTRFACWMGRATAQRARRQGLSPHPPCLAG